jgi:hypothetical protein
LVFRYFQSDKRDLKEYIPYYRDKIELAHMEAEKLLIESGVEREMGYCYVLWDCQKKLLKEKYNINWKTPAEMNKNTMFD